MTKAITVINAKMLTVIRRINDDGISRQWVNVFLLTTNKSFNAPMPFNHKEGLVSWVSACHSCTHSLFWQSLSNSFSLTSNKDLVCPYPLFIWVLHIVKVRSIPSTYWGNVEEQKSWGWPFSFYQNSFIFHFCFGLKVSTDFPEFSKILCSFVTKRTIIYFRKT